MAKSLITYTEDGSVISTICPADEHEYYLIKQQIPQGQIALIVDLQAKKVITIDETASNYKRNQLYDKYVEKNRQYLDSLELQQLRVENKELNSELKDRLARVEKSNAEFGEILFAEEDTNEEINENNGENN